MRQLKSKNQTSITDVKVTFSYQRVLPTPRAVVKVECFQVAMPQQTRLSVGLKTFQLERLQNRRPMSRLQGATDKSFQVLIEYCKIT